MTQRLVIVRHAEAAAAAPGGSDHERPLTERGMRAARALGTWLGRQGARPDAVRCSTAVRTRETWAAVSETSGFGVLVEHDRRIYDADPRTLLEVLRETEDEVRTVLLVGHNPGVTRLATTLTEGAPDVPDLTEVFHTAGCAVLDVSVPWARLAPGTASVHVTNLDLPRD